MAGFNFRLVDAGAFRLPAIVRGPAEGPSLLLLPPLFEEMNRSRRLLADLGRALAHRGIATLLPDLPGTGDDLDEPGIPAWRSAVAALIAARPCHVVTIRGSSLLTDGGNSRGLYRFSPVSSGALLLREMMRAQSIADQERTGGGAGTRQYGSRLAAGEAVILAGYEIGQPFAAEFSAMELPDPAVPCRTADVRPGQDVHFDGPQVWRQPEPASTIELAAALARDIAAWLS